MGIKRAVVTGGAGFIGSHVVDALITRGSEVLVVDDFSTGQEENLEQATSSRRVSIRRTSICSEEAARAIKEFKPELVCHLAAQMNVRRSVSEPMFDAEANIVGTINMLEAAVAAGASGFVFSSTGGAIYGEQEEFPAPETRARCGRACNTVQSG